MATRTRTSSSPAYQLDSRGQWVITSVKPRSAARATASAKASGLLSEKTGAASSER